MSRITPHCACQNNIENIDQSSIPSKTYSILPNYFAKTENNPHLPDFCLNTQNNQSNKNKLFRTYECKICQNYDNAENFINGSFRPHSCPTEDNDACIKAVRNDYSKESRDSPQISYENHQHNEKYQRKCSKSSLKTEKSKFHDQIYLMKNTVNGSTTQRLDTIHQGLNLYINNNGLPLLTPQDTRKSHSTFIGGDNIKKPSCGLKYIIFQKLSIMTHFLTKSKTNSHNVKMTKKQLSEENLFNENQYQTKRSKSFHTMDNKDGHFCDENYSKKSSTRQSKHRNYKVKESDTSNSSTGSIDAHAGSPITTSCNNILGGRSFPIMPNQFVQKNNISVKNDWKAEYTTPDIKEFSHKKNQNQTKHLNRPNIETPEFCLSHHNCHCQNCLYYFQQSCQQMVMEQMCRSHCMSQSHFQSQLPNCHCCCLNHSHVFMRPPFPQFTSLYCNQSHLYCHCSNIASNCFHGHHQDNECQFDNRPKSTLCNSCQLKNNKRCQSETLDDNKRNSEQSNQHRFSQQSSNTNIRYKLKSETKSKTFKPSTSNHSKSITSSIPPPPPPPSSLYSTNDAIIHKPKHRKHHNKSGKLCENCNVMIPQMAHSPDCTNNVQNIIYSHLNNTSTFCDPKIDHAILTTHPEVIRSFDGHIQNIQKTIKYKSTKGQIGERSDKENDKDNYQLSSSKRRGTGYGNQKEVFERRSADMLKEDPINYKPKFLSKTPETYKSKNDRRYKKHQFENQKISKHKSISTTREYKFVDSDLFYRDDSIYSPEAGSFIYHSISPMVQNNIQTVVPKKVSSFNNRQLYNYKDINYGKTELVRKAFQENMLSLREVGWYWGPLSFTEAESLMENKANGTFLVRDSGHDTYFLSLTFRVREATYHTRIEYSQGTFSFWSQPESHSATTIVEFIDKAVAHSQSGKFHYFLLTNVPGQPPMEVSLLYPLSRHQIVHSLKHMSRFVILSHIRKDHIIELSVPPVLRTYLLEKQYYISNLEEFIDMTMDAHPLSYKPSTFS